jgi:hypothetical protein
LLVTLWVASLLAGPALAQDARLLARLDPATAAEVGAVISAARAAGLPAEPLVDRALEGASKGASSARIVAAVRALARDLRAAHAALGGDALDAEITAGAGAIRAGVDPRVLSRLRAGRAEPLTVPLGVLADLVARGVPADSASRAVLLLAQAGAADGAYVSLRRNVERDIRNGAPPAIAATVRARGMPAALPPRLGPGSGGAAAPADRERSPTATGQRP